MLKAVPVTLIQNDKGEVLAQVNTETKLVRCGNLIIPEAKIPETVEALNMARVTLNPPVAKPEGTPPPAK